MSRELRTKAAEHGQRCTDYARTVLPQLDDAERAVVDGLESGGRQAESALRDGLMGALAAVDSRLAHDLAAMDTAAAAALGRIRATHATAGSDLDSGVLTATREIDAAARALDQEMDHAVTETATVVREPERPFLPGVVEQVTAARASVSTVGTTGRQQLAAAVAGTGQHLATAVTGFDGAAQALVQQVATQQAEIADGFEAAAGRAEASRAEAGGAVMTGHRQRQQDLVDGVLVEAERACADARAQLARMRGEFDSGISEAARRAVEEGARPKTDDVGTRAHEAAEQVDESVWAGLGRALKQIAVGLVVLVVVALVVAAVAAAFSIALTAWTAVMIAGGILLAASLVYALVHRLGQKELQGRPGTAILLALSDTAGLTGIYEGWKGREVLTHRPLNDAERTERGVLGAVTLISLLAGGRAALKGPPGGAYLRPVRFVPGWVKGRGLGGAAGRAWAAVKSVAGEIAGGIGRSARRVWDRITGKGSEPVAAGSLPEARMTELIREMELPGGPREFTPAHAEALRWNAEAATAKWGRSARGVNWEGITNQLNLTRWRFLPRAPEAAAILRSGLQRLPTDGPLVNGVPLRARLIGALEAWVAGNRPAPIIVRLGPHEDEPSAAHQ